MKIALIGTSSACVLGFRADLIKLLISKGHEVFAFALDYDDFSRYKVKELGAEPVDYLFSRTGLNPFSDIINTYKLSKKIKSISPDLVFSYFAKPVIFGTIAAVIAGIKRRIGMLEGLGYIFTDQPNGVSYKIRILRKIQVFLYRFSFPFLERIIFLNQDDPIDLIVNNRLSVNKYNVLGAIGLDLKSYPYSKPICPPISFIFIGRLLAEKGIHEYISAARIVKKNYPQVKFIMLGALDEGNPGGISAIELNSLINDGIVTYPGHVSNVQEWLAQASVFVLPSYYREGVPRSTQEAMAIGRPVISTDVPGCRETVIDSVNGFLIKPFSSNELAEKMIFFIKNPEQIEKMGKESFKMAQEMYDSLAVNEKLINYLVDPEFR